MFRGRKSQNDFEDTEVVVHGKLTTYGELRWHAKNMLNEDPTTWEAGMAHTILFLLDRLEEVQQK